LNDNEFISRPDESGVRYYQSDSAGDVQTVRRVKNNSLRNSIIVFICIIAVIVALGVSCNNMLLTGESEIRLPNSDYIATIYVEGTISRGNYDTWGVPYGYQHNWTLNEIDRLIYDHNNRGMIIYVESPGGGIYESDELCLKIQEYQAYTGNPVYVSMASMAASGGYYIAAPADKIFANRNCWTGSIGVTIGTLVDVSGFLENYGIRTTTIDSGINKSMGSYFDPLTDEQAGILQALVDEAYHQFVEIIAEGRDMDLSDVIELADGRIYSAKQAKENGLIDEVGTYEDAIDDMMAEYNLSFCELVDIRYAYRSWLSSFLGSVKPVDFRTGGGDAAAVLNLLEKQNKFPVSYLCEILNY